MRLLLSILVLLLAACQGDQDVSESQTSTVVTAQQLSDTDQPESTGVSDEHSFSTPDDVVTEHLSLSLNVDFEKRELQGTAELTLKQINPTNTLVLDTRDLIIESVTSAGHTLDWSLGDADENLGQPLRVSIDEDTSVVSITYRSQPQASGLQWLTAQQTAGRNHPFLFTQSQAIHARSWIPLQDTPAVRFTYDATITVPAGLRAVMSAHNDPNAVDLEQYSFSMPQAIPSYLMALAVGELDFLPISERAGVYAEPSVVVAARDEFIDTEAMMVSSEKLFGEYRWGRYDLLILPPSFPFGGMENPRLSFITPTVIAGDKSLVALIAHELAHSWSGNLVTNATWNDLWLNEGFTVYLESRIMAEVFGEERRKMEDVLGYQSLLSELPDLDPADAHLLLDLDGRDPDDAFSNVPYEKGRLFLVFLEHAVGREAFDVYLKDYFDRFAFRSLTTAQFLDDLNEHLLKPHHDKVSADQINAWINQPGLPDTLIVPESDVFTTIDSKRTGWLAGTISEADLGTSDWTVHEWLYFLNNLPEDMDSSRMIKLDEAFRLTSHGNNEIVHSWLLLAIAHRYEPAMQRMQDYMKSIGRRKLIVPLYENLMLTDWGKPIAIATFEEARSGYHPLAVGTIACIVDEQCEN